MGRARAVRPISRFARIQTPSVAPRPGIVVLDYSEKPQKKIQSTPVSPQRLSHGIGGQWRIVRLTTFAAGRIPSGALEPEGALTPHGVCLSENSLYMQPHQRTCAHGVVKELFTSTPQSSRRAIPGSDVWRDIMAGSAAVVFAREFETTESWHSVPSSCLSLKYAETPQKIRKNSFVASHKQI